MTHVEVLTWVVCTGIVLFLARMTWRTWFMADPPEIKVRTLRVSGFVVIDVRRAGDAVITVKGLAKVADLHGWGEAPNGFWWLLDPGQAYVLKHMSPKDVALIAKRMTKVGGCTVFAPAGDLGDAAAVLIDGGVNVDDVGPVIELDGEPVDLFEALERRDA